MPLPQNVLAEDIINWFRDINIRVCDDDQKIKQAIDILRPVKLAQTNQAGDTRIAAQLWFKHCNLLQSERKAAIDLVYTGKYRSSADLSLAGFVGVGNAVMTPAIEEGLRKVAREQCYTDDGLANQFATRYAVDRHLPPRGGKLPTEQPASIANFRAISEKQGIRLTFDLPPGNCKDIRILRTESTGGGSPLKFDVTHGNQHFDGDVRAGVKYVYRASARFPDSQGTDRFGTESVASAPALGEVDAPDLKVLETGAVGLAWRSPVQGVTVHVFRQAGKAPQFSRGTDEPEAVQGAERVAVTTSGTHNDHSVAAGQTYFYRFVVDFGQDIYTEGRVVSILVPKRPDPPKQIAATHRWHAGTDEVEVTWTVAPGRNESYTLVRREGPIPPANAQDGKILVNRGSGVQFTDNTAVSGHWYSYGVFACAGELRSGSPAVTPPILIRSEVNGLTAVPGNGAVELSWTPPRNVDRVIVRRGLNNYPASHQDGADVALRTPSSARDDNLANGTRHFYQVWCLYRGLQNGLPIFSQGVTVSTVPGPGPVPGRDLKCETRGGEIWLSWQAGHNGHDVLLRSAEPPPAPARGVPFQKATLGQLGEQVLDDKGIVNGRRLAVDPRPDLHKPVYTLYTSSVDRAVRGEHVECLAIPDVRGLRAQSRLGEVSLRWQWPADCREVIIMRREDAWPNGANDKSGAFRKELTLVEYGESGDRYIDIVPPRPTATRFHYVVHAVNYVVHAANTAERRQLTSPGIDPSCRAIVEGGQPMTLSYRLGSNAAGSKKGWLALDWEVKRCLPDFRGFVLVADNGGVPGSAGSGIELFRWTPDKQADGFHHELVSLAKIREENWNTFFCKLFLQDGQQSERTLVIYPDTTSEFTRSGNAVRAAQPSPPHIYRKGVPPTLICPVCLEEYRFHEMKFAFDPSGKPEPGRYTLLDRMMPPGSRLARILRREHVIKPATSNGKKANHRFCPDGHPQPSTTGDQSSLTVGLIGAKYSGKTHYVASLVEQCKRKVMLNYHGSLVDANPETSDRIGAMRRTLFVEKRPLDVTTGQPPPMIFNLEVAKPGSNSNRQTNLVLYDTAGENFQDENVASKMVQYLRIAAGVVFLINPLQIDGVRRRLSPGSVPTDVDGDGLPSTIVGNVLGLLEKGKVVGAGKVVSTPVAIALSKCDVLRDHKFLDHDRLWNLHRRHDGRFNRTWHEDMSGMIGEFLRRWDPDAYQTIVRRFPNHAFFGVSATGCAPDVRGQYPYVSPWRVEDPLLWVLSQIGVLPVKEDETDQQGTA